MDDFQTIIAKFELETNDKMNVSMRKIAIEVFRRIILGTPVRSGRARGNWQASISSPKLTSIDALDKTGQVTISRMRSEVASWNPEDELPAFITNNLPYIKRLNEGWSKQAPANFIEQVISDLGGIAETSV